MARLFCERGLEPNFLHWSMSDLKLRPPQEINRFEGTAGKR